jgi:hypothetical protein
MFRKIFNSESILKHTKEEKQRYLEKNLKSRVTERCLKYQGYSYEYQHQIHGFGCK